MTAAGTTFEISIDGEIAAIVPCTTSAEIHRYKACAGQRGRQARQGDLAWRELPA